MIRLRLSHHKSLPKSIEVSEGMKEDDKECGNVCLN